MRLIKYIFIFLFASSIGYANQTRTVFCPSIQQIQQAAEKLDTVQKVEDKYLVYTAKIAFQENKLSWFITTAVHANTHAEALKRAKKQLHLASSKEELATLIGKDYRCKYDDGIIQAWGKDLTL